MIISFVVFPDEDDAIKFHNELVDRDSNNLTGYGILVGSYKLPTRFCDGVWPRKHKNEGWTYLPKRGWWVCPICKRPTPPPPDVADFSTSAFGTNIMEQIKNSKLGDKL